MKKHFVTGLVILLPLVVTILIIAFLVDLLTDPFIGIVSASLHYLHLDKLGLPIFSSETFIIYLSKFLILVFLFVAIFLLGYVGEKLFFKAMVRISDSILHKIPIVNKVYKTSKEIVHTLFVADKESFKQVVLVPFPCKGTYAIGLVSRASPKACRESLQNDDLLSVLVPTTPTPTNGFMLMCKREDLIFLDMTTEDAIKYIVSCGVIVPKEPKETS